MSTRLETLRILAWSLPDMQPGPKESKFWRTQIRGEAPGAWALCDPCQGHGTVKDKFGRGSACDTCNGAGRYRVDAFTQHRVSSVDSHAGPKGRRVTCDRCGGSGVMPGRWVGQEGLVRCETCDGSGTTLAAFTQGIEEKRTVLDSPLAQARAKGDWDALERVLGILSTVDRRAWQLFVRHRVLVQPVTGPRDAIRLRDVEDALLHVLPTRLRVPADVRVAYEQRSVRAVEKASSRAQRVARGGRRKVLAREMVLAGVPVVEVARQLGVSERTVRRNVAA